MARTTSAAKPAHAFDPRLNDPSEFRVINWLQV
jgi:hypothetical protein